MLQYLNHTCTVSRFMHIKGLFFIAKCASNVIIIHFQYTDSEDINIDRCMRMLSLELENVYT